MWIYFVVRHNISPHQIMKEASRSGTQSIERAVLVLRELAARGKFGWGLWDLAARCKLSRATTHRILACLIRERMAHQRESDRRYVPGPLIFELSLAMPAYAEFQSMCAAPLARLAKRFNAQSILKLRSGTDWVCAGYAGQSVYVGGGLEVGMRRPLASTAGGVAILIALPADEARAIFEQNLKDLERMGDDAVFRFEKMIARSHGLGYAFNQSETTHGVHSFGVPLREPGPSRQVFGALAVTGHAADFPVERAPEVIAAMREAAQGIEREAMRIFHH